MPRRDALWDVRPTVVVKHPNRNDAGLLSAWRLTTDHSLREQLLEELKVLKLLKSERRRVQSAITKMTYDPYIAGKLYRISRMKRVVWLRQNSDVQYSHLM